VTQLEDELAVMFMDALAQGPPKRDLIIIINHGVPCHNATANSDWREGRDNGPHPSAREFFGPVDTRICSVTVVVIKCAGDIRPEEPVLDLQVAKLDRIENDPLVIFVIGWVLLCGRSYFGHLMILPL
jgi:hypothetical protein